MTVRFSGKLPASAKRAADYDSGRRAVLAEGAALAAPCGVVVAETAVTEALGDASNADAEGALVVDARDVGRYLKVMDDGTLPHFIPDRRERLLDSLAALGEPEDVMVDTRLWGHVVIDTDACASCQMCAVFCPTGALAKFTDADGTFGVEHRPSDCVKCRSCEAICPEHAIEISEEVFAVDLLGGVTDRYVMRPRAVQHDHPPHHLAQSPNHDENRPSLRALIHHHGFHQIDELVLGVDVQLAVDVTHVGVGRARGNVESLLDGGGIAALRQKEQHLGFLARQQKGIGHGGALPFEASGALLGRFLDGGSGWLRNIARCRRDGSRRIRWHRHHGFFDGRFACGNFPAHQLFQVGLVVQQRAEATAYERAAHLGAVGQRRNAEGQRDEPDQSQHHRFGRRRFQKTAWLQHEKTGEGAGGQKAVTEAEGGKGAHTVALGDVGVHDPQGTLPA